MIPRHTKGRPVGLAGAVPGTVVGISDRSTVIEAAGGLRLTLSEDDAGPGPGVYRLRRPAPYLEGDIVLVDPGGSVELLFRPSWEHNSILVTQRCDSLCVMCSQPPRTEDDSPRIEALIEAARLLPAGTRSVGITGGEPTLLGLRLVELVRAIGVSAPEAGVHILSNGRSFRGERLARALGAVRHPDLMIGIPLYADTDNLHDRIVGAPGAFDETMAGLENLGRAGVPVEIRVVLHRPSVERLEAICAFVCRNLPYVAQVVLMGLEPTGYAVPNLRDLWIDPAEMSRTLERAVEYLTVRGVRTRLYNLQLCTLPTALIPFATRSISDWKNEFLPACEGCQVRDSCCGFFSSAVTRSIVANAVSPMTSWPP